MKKNAKSKHKILGIFTDWARPNTDGSYGAVGWYRIVSPLEKLGATIVGKYSLEATPECAMDMKNKGDIWVTKMIDSTGADIILGSGKEFTGSKLVLDIDDDPTTINEDHPDKDKILEKMPAMQKMVRMADHVICSTEPLKQAIKQLNNRATVIPNAIDPKIWDVKVKKRKDGKIRIVWIASGSHLADMPIIHDAMRHILAKYQHVEFHMAGIMLGDFDQNRVFHHTGTQGYQNFPQFYADLSPDISIAPLKDTQFNRCKSNIKWLEAAMLKIPVVASDVKPYSDSITNYKNGYLASNTNQWIKYLSWLIENEEKRREIGEAAYREVMEKWTIEKIINKYEELFDKLMENKEISVVTAITGDKDELKDEQETEGAHFIAFTDDEEVKSEVWDVKKACDKFVKPVMNAKIHKILTHKYVTTPYSIWIDGTIELRKKPEEVIALLGDKDIAVYIHAGRDCIYKEAEVCIAMEKGKREEILEQIKDYARDNHPENGGLAECTIIIRKHTDEMNALCEKWWAEICRYSERDQISFPKAFPKDKVQWLEGAVWASATNPYFKFSNHKK